LAARCVTDLQQSKNNSLQHGTRRRVWLNARIIASLWTDTCCPYLRIFIIHDSVKVSNYHLRLLSSTIPSRYPLLISGCYFDVSRRKKKARNPKLELIDIEEASAVESVDRIAISSIPT